MGLLILVQGAGPATAWPMHAIGVTNEIVDRTKKL